MIAMKKRFMAFRRSLRAELSVFGLLLAWTLAVYLRSQYTHKYELAWFVGNGAGLVCALTAGYVLRGLINAKRRYDASLPKSN